MSFALDHIQMAIPKGGENTARAFWCDLVGLEEIEKPETLRARGGLWLQLGETELHLGIETPFSPAKKAHPGLVTNDIEVFSERLQKAGHPVTWDTSLTDRKRFFTEDPFGNRLEILQPTTSGSQ